MVQDTFNYANTNKNNCTSDMSGSEGKLKATCGIRTAIEAAQLARALSCWTYKRNDWQMRLLSMLGWSNNDNITGNKNISARNENDIGAEKAKQRLPPSLHNSPFSVSTTHYHHYQSSSTDDNNSNYSSSYKGEGVHSVERVYNSMYNSYITPLHT